MTDEHLDPRDASRRGPDWTVERVAGRCYVTLRRRGRETERHEITAVEFRRAMDGEIGPGYFWRRYERKRGPLRLPAIRLEAAALAVLAVSLAVVLAGWI